MVLIGIILFFFGFENTEPLSEKYQKRIQKAVHKSFELKDYKLRKESDHLSEIFTIEKDSELKGYLVIAEVAACNLGGCPSYDQIKADRNSEYFDLLMITDSKKSIVHLSILDYFSDYGYEITSKKYLKNFIGKDICDFNSDKDGIDAISGATISCYALEGIIALTCERIDNNFEKISSN